MAHIFAIVEIEIIFLLMIKIEKKIEFIVNSLAVFAGNDFILNGNRSQGVML